MSDRDALIVCAWCGDQLNPRPRGRPPIYCSDSHRQQAYQQRRIDRAVAEAVGGHR